MNLSRRIKVCAIALLLSLLPCSVGMCSEYRITEEQLNALEIQFQELSENNQRLEILLSESERDLMDSQEQSEILKAELQEVKKSLNESMRIINQLKADSESAKQSLEIANAELQTVCESVKQLDNQRKKAEREKNLWKIISAILGVVAVTR